MPEQLNMFLEKDTVSGRQFVRLPDGRFSNRFQRELAIRDHRIASLEKRNRVLERQASALAKANTVLQMHAGVNTSRFL